MVNEWEYKELPKAKGMVAPAYWNAETETWDVYEGNTSIASKLDGIDKRLEDIESGKTTINTQLTGSNMELDVKQMSIPLKVKNVVADSSDEVEAGGVIVTEITPPEGVVWRTPLIWAMAKPPTSSSSGTHQIEITHGVNSYFYIVLRATASHDNNCRIMSNVAESADKGSLPESHGVQQSAIQSLVFTKDKPLFISYRNSTDAIQKNALTIKLMVTEERVSQ